MLCMAECKIRQRKRAAEAGELEMAKSQPLTLSYLVTHCSFIRWIIPAISVTLFFLPWTGNYK